MVIIIKLKKERDKLDDKELQHTWSSGLLSRIFSIFSITSGVNLGMTSIALRFSMICSGLDAPRMTVDVLGFFAIHAKASAVTVVSSSGGNKVAGYESSFENTRGCLLTLLSQPC